MFVLFNVLLGLLVALAVPVISAPWWPWRITSNAISTMGFAWMALALCPSVAAAVRRLHDSDLSASNFLWLLVPCVGSFITLAFLLRRGSPGENRYGPDPRAEPCRIRSTHRAAFAVWILFAAVYLAGACLLSPSRVQFETIVQLPPFACSRAMPGSGAADAEGLYADFLAGTGAVDGRLSAAQTANVQTFCAGIAPILLDFRAAADNFTAAWKATAALFDPESDDFIRNPSGNRSSLAENAALATERYREALERFPERALPVCLAFFDRAGDGSSAHTPETAASVRAICSRVTAADAAALPVVSRRAELLALMIGAVETGDETALAGYADEYDRLAGRLRASAPQGE